MSTDWKPGDVVEAFVHSRGWRHLLMYVGARGGDWPWRLLDDGGVDANHSGIGGNNVREAKRVIDLLDGLVTIDPDDAEQIERLDALIVQRMKDNPLGRRIPGLAAALREFASPTPPKCGALLIIDGDHYHCDLTIDHDGAHSNAQLVAIWGTA